jgi:hypothetical protein
MSNNVLKRGLTIIGFAIFSSSAHANLIVNGDFEAGGGSLAGWTTQQTGTWDGNWYLQTGTNSPLHPFRVMPSPPQGAFAAMTDQRGSGATVLYQSFVVPFSVQSATIDFSWAIKNQGVRYYTPNSLSEVGAPNQQARVDILTASAGPFSVAANDVLLNLFQTEVGDPLISGYNTFSLDVTSLFQDHMGETLTLRFSEVDNQEFLFFGVDAINVDVDVNAVPEPGALGLLAVGLLGLNAARKRKGVTVG